MSFAVMHNFRVSNRTFTPVYVMTHAFACAQSAYSKPPKFTYSGSHRLLIRGHLHSTFVLMAGVGA